MGSGYEKQITSLRFNQDKSCFMCCMDNGLRIYYVEPLVEKVHYDEKAIGSVGFCEMVWRSNLFAVVSGGSRPKYADNSVLIFDDRTKQAVLDFSFNQAVLSVRCRKDRLIVVLRNKIHIFTFPNNPKKLYTMETKDNPLGLCEVSPSTFNGFSFLVFPGHQPGHVAFMNLATTEATVSSSPITIKAHDGELACIAINQQGHRVATASTKGTLIRVWDAVKKTLLITLRRGTDHATIFCINFSPDSDFLCCSSDKGTVHVFALKDSQLNRRSTLSNIGFLGNYVDAQASSSLANFSVPPECACICAFSTNNSVVAICMDGTYHKYIFNATGVCSRLAFDVFLEVCGDDEF